jgi:hypothetical protein
MTSDDEFLFSISKLSAASVAEDLSFVNIEFETEDGGKVGFRMLPMDADQIAGKLSEFVLFIRSRTLTKGDHLAVHASEAADLTAGAAAGGDKVILSVKGNNGIVNHFAVPIEVAARFRPELRQAVQSAEKQRKQTRQ